MGSVPGFDTRGGVIPTVFGLDVIAQLALGLAGFSGVILALAHPAGGLSVADRFRLRALSYASFGAMFLAIIPFAMLKAPWPESVSWRLLGLVMTLYTAFGLAYFPRASFFLRRDHPDLFKDKRFSMVQFVNDVCRFLLALVVLFGSSRYQATAYTMVLILLLLQGSIAFVRTLLHSKH
jgi:hypothetical protein